MNEIKDAFNSRLKHITFSQQMKNKVLEECRQSGKVKHKYKRPLQRTLIPITFFLVFCISIAMVFIGLKNNNSEEKLGGEKALLRNNEVFSQYDVTGDGKVDKVKVEFEESHDYNLADSWDMTIYINGQEVFSDGRTSEAYWNIQLIKLENGKVFFDIHSALSNNDGHVHRLYGYEDDELKCVYDFQEYYGEYAYSYVVNIVNISGNTLNTEVSAQFYTTGKIQYRMDLDYKGGKIGYFESSSDTFDIRYEDESKENKWTVNTDIKIYAEAGSEEIAYTLKRENIVKLNKVIFKDNIVYFQVENDKGEIGYILADTTYPDVFYFKEVQFLE